MKKSFTLIELAVVVGITLLLVTGVVMGLSSGRQEREVKTAAEQVRTMILEARSRAMNPSDEAMGLQRVEIRIDKSVPNKVEIVEISNVLGFISEDVVQEYTPSKFVRITPDESVFGNDATNYYFSFDASYTLYLGYIFFKGTTTPSKGQGIIDVSDASGTVKYQLKIYAPAGNVEIEAG